MTERAFNNIVILFLLVLVSVGTPYMIQAGLVDVMHVCKPASIDEWAFFIGGVEIICGLVLFLACSVLLLEAAKK